MIMRNDHNILQSLSEVEGSKVSDRAYDVRQIGYLHRRLCDALWANPLAWTEQMKGELRNSPCNVPTYLHRSVQILVAIFSNGES